MLSIDNKIHKGNEQQHAEGNGEKSNPGYSSSSGSTSQIERIDAALQRPGIPPSAKKELLNKKFQLMNGTVGISFDDTQALLQQLQRFQETIGSDWKLVMSQWQNLQGCWQDRQYERFEPFFESLCRTYSDCERQCEEYTQFLESRIRASEGAATTLNL